MNTKVYAYDPTLNDSLSAVRGIGRYLATLRQSFDSTLTFTGDIKSVQMNSIFLNPFYDFLKPPLTYRRIANWQLTVIHDLIPLKYSRKFPAGIRGNLHIILNSFLLKHYDVIITDSYASQHDIHMLLHIDKQRIHIAYPPLSSSFLDAVKQKYNETILDAFRLPKNGYCIYVGDATWNKNLIHIAQAVKIANIPCVFVGKVFEKRNGGNLNHPWMSELREFIRITRGDKRFIFPGFVTDEQLVALYEHAKLNILVSRDEGLGYSFIEAAACATPSVLADIPVFHETAQDAALFADPEDPKDIATRISTLFNSPAMARNIGVLAKQRSGFFSIETFKQTLSDLLYNGYNP
ncbi:MAG: hypothetical protein RI947_1093 [Candidatus Parcubacteria bacterium]|jgi:glycosyltransferase involved in cell wall biosynthesis